MPTSDQQVTSRMVLQVLLELKRQGIAPALRHLEQIEPDLADYVMESLSALHQKVLELGAPTRKTDRLFRQIQDVLIVCIQSLRRGHHALWQQQMGGALEQLADSPDLPEPERDPSDPP